MPVTPEVLWAQRSSNSDPKRNIIYLTINAQDVDQESLKLNITSSQLDLEGKSSTTEEQYKLHIDFFKDIVTTNVKQNITGSHIFLILGKVELGDEYWPRLTKEKLKYNYIRTDFDKWVDEDEQDLEELDKDNGLDDIDDLQQFRDQNLDFSSLSQQLGLKNSAELSKMAEMDESDSDDDESKNEEEEEEEEAEE